MAAMNEKSVQQARIKELEPQARAAAKVEERYAHALEMYKELIELKKSEYGALSQEVSLHSFMVLMVYLL